MQVKTRTKYFQTRFFNNFMLYGMRLFKHKTALDNVCADDGEKNALFLLHCYADTLFTDRHIFAISLVEML